MNQAREEKSPAAKLVYRVATADDTVALQRMIQDSFRVPDTWAGDTSGAMSLYRITLDRMAEKMTRPGSKFVIATEPKDNGGEAEEIVACFQVVRKSPTLARFATFAVAPKHQGRGLARQIVRYAENYCRSTWGSTTMQLNTLSSRVGLLQWYHRCGYHETGVTEPFASPSFGAEPDEEMSRDLQFIVMEKELEAAAN